MIFPLFSYVQSVHQLLIMVSFIYLCQSKKHILLYDKVEQYTIFLLLNRVNNNGPGLFLGAGVSIFGKA